MKYIKSSSLCNRVHRFLRSNSSTIVRAIPIHPSDFTHALKLRKLGLIPNIPIKVLGGFTFGVTAKVEGGAK